MTAAQAPTARTRQAARGASARVVRAAASSKASDSSSSPLPLSSSRREALALGAASLALSLGSGVVSTPSARAEEGGEWNGCELGERKRRRSFESVRSKKTQQREREHGTQPRHITNKKNRIHDPLRHRLAADVLRRLRRKRAGDCQVRFVKN